MARPQSPIMASSAVTSRSDSVILDFESAEPDSGNVSTSVIADETRGSRGCEAPTEPAEAVAGRDLVLPRKRLARKSARTQSQSLPMWIIQSGSPSRFIASWLTRLARTDLVRGILLRRCNGGVDHDVSLPPPRHPGLASRRTIEIRPRAFWTRDRRRCVIGAGARAGMRPSGP